jgi:hypothetical protein
MCNNETKKNKKKKKYTSWTDHRLVYCHQRLLSKATFIYIDIDHHGSIIYTQNKTKKGCTKFFRSLSAIHKNTHAHTHTKIEEADARPERRYSYGTPSLACT